MVAVLIALWLLRIILVQAAQLRPPRITEHPLDLLVKKHDPATLNCKADGNPEPAIEWYHEGVLVEDTTANRNRMVFPGGSLFVLHVLQNKREHDTGVYWCEAVNDLGRVKSKNATLEVAVLREEFRLSPKDVRAAMGDSATLECVPPKGYPEPNVRWKKDGEFINTSKGRFRVVSPGSLVISDVRQSDEGQYKCVVDNMAGTRESSTAALTVHVKPFFVREPEHVTVLANEDVEFECRVGGDPLPTITWRRQDGKMPVGRAQIQEDKSLLVKDVSSSDEGTYICEAENPVGIVSASVTLTVHSRPIFLVTPRDQRVGLNGIAKFECTATGNPPPSVFWTKEGNQVLMFPERSYGRSSVAREGTLVISDVRKDDKGYYICSVLSGIGSSMAKAYLEVTAVGDLPPPIILYGPANQTLPLSTVAMLPCEATGTPTPSIRWSVNSGPLPTHLPRFTVLDSGTLQVDDLQSTDSGIYTCTASSESGETSWSASLSVESPRNPNSIFHRAPDPSTFPGPPGQPTGVNVTEKSVTLSWQKSGNLGSSSLIGYRVEYYSSDLQSGWTVTAHHVATESHVIHNLRPDTHYTFIVRAENSHGLGLPSPASKVMKTQGLPAHMLPDYDLEEARIQLSTIVVELQDIRPISSTAMKLFWRIQGAAEHVEGFYIRFRDLSSGSQKYNMVTVLNGGASSYVLADLRKYTKYEFFLVPFYKSVEGPPSNTQSAQTLEDAPSAPPDNLHVEILSINSAAIYWSSPPPQHINGGLKGYVVQIYENDSALHSNITTNGTTTAITLRNLTAGMHYKVKAEAFTHAGLSPATKFIPLHIDPHMVGKFDTGLSRRSSSSFHAVVQQPWFIALLGSFVFLLLSIFLVAVFLRRRMAWKKALGVQLNVPIHKNDGIRGVNSCETLWINQTLSSNHAEKTSTTQSKLLDKQDVSMEHNYYSVCAPDYAEVDTHSMATFYKRELPCVLAPYATTTLINTPKNSTGSVYDSKSSSSEISKKSDKLHELNSRLNEMNEDRQDALMESQSHYQQTGNFLMDDYSHQNRKLKNKLLHGTSRAPVVNWTDVIPAPPEHPPHEQLYQGNLGKQGSPWSTLGRTAVDPEMGNPMAMFGIKHGSLMPQRTLPQNLTSIHERNMQSTVAALMNASQMSNFGRRISQNGMIATSSGMPFTYFLKPSTSDIINQKHPGVSSLQNLANHTNNALDEGEKIELNNIFTNRTSFNDDAPTNAIRNISNSSFPEESQPITGSKNEYYSNNFFIAEYQAGKALTSIRNRPSRPPSSYSNDSNSGTVPSRTRQNWKEVDKTENEDSNVTTDDIPSYNKPSFPSCSSSTASSSVGRKRRDLKGMVGELSPLSAFTDLAEKKYGSNPNKEAEEETDVTEDRR